VDVNKVEGNFDSLMHSTSVFVWNVVSGRLYELAVVWWSNYLGDIWPLGQLSATLWKQESQRHRSVTSVKQVIIYAARQNCVLHCLLC